MYDKIMILRTSHTILPFSCIIYHSILCKFSLQTYPHRQAPLFSVLWSLIWNEFLQDFSVTDSHTHAVLTRNNLVRIILLERMKKAVLAIYLLLYICKYINSWNNHSCICKSVYNWNNHNYILCLFRYENCACHSANP